MAAFCGRVQSGCMSEAAFLWSLVNDCSSSSTGQVGSRHGTVRLGSSPGPNLDLSLSLFVCLEVEKVAAGSNGGAATAAAREGALSTPGTFGRESGGAQQR